MLWINGKMTDLTKKDAIHKLVDAKCFLERYSNPHDKWTEAINIGIEAIEIVMDQEEQAPFKPMVEIDLYSVIKQKYIEREVLDKIRAEIETEKLEDSPNFCIKAHNIAVDRVLQIIDEYKADKEQNE